MKKALVTGATGFSGNVLTKKLLEKGCMVRGLVRDANKMQFSHPNLEIVEGDLCDDKTLTKIVKDMEIVYNIAAIFREAGIKDQLYWDINYEATKKLVELSNIAGVKRFVHCSTVGVHGHIENPPGNETSPLDPGDIYQITKLEGEKAVLDYYHKTGFAVSVVRPGPIYGIGDTRLLKIFQLAAKKPIPVIGKGEIYFNMVHVEDLADAFILAGEKEGAIGEVFIAAGPENFTLNEILDLISDILGKSNKKIHLPVKPFQIAGELCEKICIPFKIEPPIYRRRVDFFIKSRIFDISKAMNILGYLPKYDYKKGLTETANWYIREGLLNG